MLKLQYFGNPNDVKSWLIRKDPDAGNDWRQEEKGTKENEIAGWHHGLNGRESEWTLGVGNGQGGLACCDSWCRRVGHDCATELNWIHVDVWQKQTQYCKTISLQKRKKHDWCKPTSSSRACALSLMELVPAFCSPLMCSSSTLPSNKVTLLWIWLKSTYSFWDLLLSECLGMISILIN